MIRNAIWMDEYQRVHVIHDRQEMVFDTMYDFIDAMDNWRDFTIGYMLKFDTTPQEAWVAFAEANKN